MSIISQNDLRTISAIVERAHLHFPDRTPLDIRMDLIATHGEACPLRLDDLLAANDFDFLHDIVGIERHLIRDAKPWALGDGFTPRFHR